MRTVLLVLALAAAAGCAKKSKAAAPVAPAATEAAPGNTTGAEAPADTEDKDKVQGDPCDGGENKVK